jgi:hypothetical protein
VFRKRYRQESVLGNFEKSSIMNGHVQKRGVDARTEGQQVCIGGGSHYREKKRI